MGYYPPGVLKYKVLRTISLILGITLIAGGISTLYYPIIVLFNNESGSGLDMNAKICAGAGGLALILGIVLFILSVAVFRVKQHRAEGYY